MSTCGKQYIFLKTVKQKMNKVITYNVLYQILYYNLTGDLELKIIF